MVVSERSGAVVDDLNSAATSMWPRVFRVGSWIAAGLGGLVALVALFWFVVGAIIANGRLSGIGLVFLSPALLLATPLAIRFAIRRWGRMVAACVVAAVVVFGTFIVGFLLILGSWN